MGLFGVTELFEPAAMVELMGDRGDRGMTGALDLHLTEEQRERYERTRALGAEVAQADRRRRAPGPASTGRWSRRWPATGCSRG